MRLRRDRTHQHGKANRDFKTLDQERADIREKNSSMRRLEFLATAKNKKNFQDVIERTMKRVATAQIQQDPFAETATAYMNRTQYPEKHYATTKIGYPRFAHLEEKELRKRVFVGDSNIIFTQDMQVEGEKSPNQKMIKKIAHQKLIREKHDAHANVIQETQLVGLEEFNKNTLEGKIDLNKIREIRRAIRRRYANRKNFQKIFNLWDEDSNGAISLKNLYTMIHKLGINLNIDEARVLLASADKDGSGDLALDEFLELIFNEKDALNIKLKDIPVLSENEKEEILKGSPFVKGSANEDVEFNENTIKYLREDAQKTQKQKHTNQVNLILKNKIHNLKMWLNQADQLQKGHLNYVKFESAIKKLQIDAKIISDADMKGLFDHFKSSEDTIEYNKFLEHLNEFQLPYDDIYDDPYKKKDEVDENQVFNTKQIMIRDMKAKEEQKINVFDCTRVNAWHLERMRTRANNMFKKIKRYITTKDDFNDFLKQKQDEKKIMNIQEFQGLITQFLATVNEFPHRFDMESLLSVLQFGVHETLPVDRISELVFDETEEQFYDRAQLRFKGPHPLPYKTLIKEGEEQKQNEQIKNEAANSEPVYFQKQLGMQESAPNMNKDLTDILLKIEHSVFRPSEKAFNVFKAFDKDNDGYISHVDLQTKIQQMHILNEKELNTLLKYVDPENKGFSTYSEFHSKLRSGMTITSKDGDQLVLPESVPDKERVTAFKNFLPVLQKERQEIKQRMFNHEQNELHPATRYGASPPFQNTFVNVVAQKNSAMYASPQEQFTRNNPNGFQHEEKSKKDQTYQAKLKRIQERADEQRSKIDNQTQQIQQKEDSKMKTKGLAQWTYEHKAHLRNDYL